MSEAEGVQNTIQVGAAEGVNDPGDIPWSTTSWSAGAEDVASTRFAKHVAMLAGKTVTFDVQGTALSENVADEECQGMKGPRDGNNVLGLNEALLTTTQKKEKKWRQHKIIKVLPMMEIRNIRDGTARHLAKLSKL